MPRTSITIKRIEIMTGRGQDRILFVAEHLAKVYDDDPWFELRVPSGTALDYLRQNFGLEPDKVIKW